eukprot:539527-Amphidinium_carterae.1
MSLRPASGSWLHKLQFTEHSTEVLVKLSTKVQAPDSSGLICTLKLRLKWRLGCGMWQQVQKQVFDYRRTYHFCHNRLD